MHCPVSQDYANVNYPVITYSKKRLKGCDSERIYENVSISEGEAHSGPKRSDSKKKLCKAAVALLCFLLLLAGLVTLTSLFIKRQSEGRLAMAELRDKCDNVTEERDELQRNHSSLISTTHQLQTSYNNVVKQKEDLMIKYIKLSKEKYELQIRLKNKTGCQDIPLPK
ncbi:unnamed protein product [Ophioblennius macclurei]